MGVKFFELDGGAGMKLRVTLPNGKQLLFVNGVAYQRWYSSEAWEPFDRRILIHTGIPRESRVVVEYGEN